MTIRRFTRRLTWVCLAHSVVALAFGLTVRLLALIPGVTEANIRRIHLGMSANDVGAILGEPTEDGALVVVNEPPNDEMRRIAARWEKLLNEMLDTSDFQKQMPLKKVLRLLQDKLWAKYKNEGELPIVVDVAAFKVENPDAPDIYDSLVTLAPQPGKISVGAALSLALSKLPTDNATYLVRHDGIEVTTAHAHSHRVVNMDGLVIPTRQSRWELWLKSGTPRTWNWCEGQLSILVTFDEHRQVSAVVRDVFGGRSAMRPDALLGVSVKGF
jgi:hypothetical protein